MGAVAPDGEAFRIVTILPWLGWWQPTGSVHWQPVTAPIPSGQFPVAVMAAVPSNAPGLHRLADQLQLLSEVSESLTYRLLELEERLGAHELHLGSLVGGGTGLDEGQAEDMELRMGDTEERLARIEAVLSGLERPGAARHLHSVHHPALQQEPVQKPSARSGDELHQEPNEKIDEDLFLEEGEQPFMDELIA
jgi:hypothetical protein